MDILMGECVDVLVSTGMTYGRSNQQSHDHIFIDFPSDPKLKHDPSPAPCLTFSCLPASFIIHLFVYAIIHSFAHSKVHYVPEYSTGNCLTGGARALEEADGFGNKVSEFLFEQTLTGPHVLPVPSGEGTW
jgi:hypothetical protein